MFAFYVAAIILILYQELVQSKLTSTFWNMAQLKMWWNSLKKK